jgi:hypothetical protein
MVMLNAVTPPVRGGFRGILEFEFSLLDFDPRRSGNPNLSGSNRGPAPSLRARRIDQSKVQNPNSQISLGRPEIKRLRSRTGTKPEIIRAIFRRAKSDLRPGA